MEKMIDPGLRACLSQFVAQMLDGSWRSEHYADAGWNGVDSLFDPLDYNHGKPSSTCEDGDVDDV